MNQRPQSQQQELHVNAQKLLKVMKFLTLILKLLFEKLALVKQPKPTSPSQQTMHLLQQSQQPVLYVEAADGTRGQEEHNEGEGLENQQGILDSSLSQLWRAVKISEGFSS